MRGLNAVHPWLSGFSLQAAAFSNFYFSTGWCFCKFFGRKKIYGGEWASQHYGRAKNR
jgi:hypothetical protein